MDAKHDNIGMKTPTTIVILARKILLSPPALFLGLALLVLGPLLAPGHILTVDSTLAINQDIEGFFWGTDEGPEGVFGATYSSAPIGLLQKLLGLVLPSDLVEKLWLILIFWLSGYGAYRLPYLDGKARYYAGILYTINPFTYIRFVSGQWGLLGSYALIPIAFTTFHRMLKDPSPGNAVRTAIVLTFAGLMQTHGLVLILLLLTIFFISYSLMKMKREYISVQVKTVMTATLLFLGINCFWIVRYLIAGDAVTSNMDPLEIDFFVATSFGEVLSLRGFWLSRGFLDIYASLPFWRLFFIPIFLIAVYGAMQLWDNRSSRWIALSLIIIGCVAILLATGPRLSFTEPIFQGIWDNFHPYRAFRDSHKFVALLAFVYAYLGAYGFNHIVNIRIHLSGMKRTITTMVLISIFVVPFIYTAPIFGSGGQLKTTEYPEDWHRAKEILDQDSGDYNVLILPWHMYMRFDWLPNEWSLLANPAPTFFSQPTISGDNLEIAPTESNSSNLVSEYVEAILENRDSVQNLGELLSPINAKYLVLFPNRGFEKDYSFIEEQHDIERIFNGDNISLFINKFPTKSYYSPKHIRFISDMGKFMNLDSPREPLDTLYLFGQPIEGSDERTQSTLNEDENASQPTVVKTSPVSYSISGIDMDNIVITLPQRTVKTSWTYAGDETLLNLGMMPSINKATTDGSVTFSRFYRIYLPTYLISIASLSIACYIYIRRNTKPSY